MWLSVLVYSGLTKNVLHQDAWKIEYISIILQHAAGVSEWNFFSDLCMRLNLWDKIFYGIMTFYFFPIVD